MSVLVPRPSSCSTEALAFRWPHICLGGVACWLYYASVGGDAVPGDVLMALAQFAGQTVAQAAITDVWEAARDQFAKLIGRGNDRKTEVAERWLTETHDQLTAATGSALEMARHMQAQRWTARFADLLDEDPHVAKELRALVDEIKAQLSTQAVSADDHSVAAGQDVNIAADRGGTAAGVIHGNVGPVNPTWPGPESQ